MTATLREPEVGRARLRKEDARLIAGRTRWTENITLPGMLHLAILRSPYAHARLASVNTAPALGRPNVVAAFSGADLAQICDEVYQSYPLSRVRLLKLLYNRFRLTHQNQIAYFWLKKADFARTGADTNDTEGLIDHIRAIEPVVVACVFEEVEPELTRVSLRSKSEKVDVN